MLAAAVRLAAMQAMLWLWRNRRRYCANGCRVANDGVASDGLRYNGVTGNTGGGCWRRGLTGGCGLRGVNRLKINIIEASVMLAISVSKMKPGVLKAGIFCAGGVPA